MRRRRRGENIFLPYMSDPLYSPSWRQPTSRAGRYCAAKSSGAQQMNFRSSKPTKSCTVKFCPSDASCRTLVSHEAPTLSCKWFPWVTDSHGPHVHPGRAVPQLLLHQVRTFAVGVRTFGYHHWAGQRPPRSCPEYLQVAATKTNAEVSSKNRHANNMHCGVSKRGYAYRVSPPWAPALKVYHRGSPTHPRMGDLRGNCGGPWGSSRS